MITVKKEKKKDDIPGGREWKKMITVKREKKKDGIPGRREIKKKRGNP